MPAYFEEGFSVREKPWHGLGHVLQEYPGREKAMELAGHDFTVEEVPLFVGETVQQGDEDVARPTDEQADGWKGIRRSDSRKTLGIVGKYYTVVQNNTMWDLVDALVGEPEVQYETAGVLRGGAVLWVLARLDEIVTVPGDDSKTIPYCLVSTHHDGTGALKAGGVATRVVCWNTYSLAESEALREGRHYTFRHTGNVEDRIEDAKNAIRGVKSAFAEYVELARELAELTVSDMQVEDFLSRFIPMPDPAEGQVVSTRVRNNVEKARDRVRTTLLHGQTIPDAHRRTGYGLLQAGIEYTDHVRKARSDQSYFRRTMMRQEKVKDHLIRLIRETAA